jgi:hypothetical protein
MIMVNNKSEEIKKLDAAIDQMAYNLTLNEDMDGNPISAKTKNRQRRILQELINRRDKEISAERYRRETAELTKTERKRLEAQAERDRFARSYMARDYTSGITAHTATMVPPRRPWNQSGLRQEWQIYGYKSPSSGIVGADFHIKNPVIKTKGSLTGKGKLTTKSPGMINVDILGVNVGGLGDVIMPSLGILKIKGRKKL